MGEHAAVVTDTHPLVFHLDGRWGRKGAAARAHFQACDAREALTYVPAAVIWECSLLARARRIRLARSVRHVFEDLFSNPAYQPVDLTPEQVYLAADNQATQDPFDALVCAAAQALGLPLLTRDEQIRGSGLVQVVW